eukprot:GHVO01015733.1.p1 GENE.GHVO01015733.1~~GHVO01015733.1.p1  ORF type:complete len:108 (+),score=18.05 GHVO01015733.1:351-674(+)
MSMGAMKGASAQLKKEMQKVNVEAYENLQDEYEDMMMDMSDVNASFERSYALSGIDNTDLEQDFASLQEQIAAESEVQGPRLDYLPCAPSGTMMDKGTRSCEPSIDF